MNYLKIYKSIIRSAQKRKDISQYSERHHIIPKCLLKHKPNKIKNGKWNLVKLTAREHFIAHLLLWKFFKSKLGEDHRYTILTLYAVRNFSHRKADKRAEYKINSRTYEVLKSNIRRNVSYKGTSHHFYGKTGTNAICYGRTKEKHPMFGKSHTEEAKKKISEAGKNRNHTESTKRILREKNLGKKNPMYIKSGTWKITFITGKQITVKNLSEFARENGYSSGKLSSVYSLERKSHKDIIKIERIH